MLYVVLDTALPEPHRAASDLVWPAYLVTYVYVLRYDICLGSVRITIRYGSRMRTCYDTWSGATRLRV